MKKVNLIFGLILFAVFVGTGMYMRMIFIPEHAVNDLLRMQIRSNHIYILMIALLNILSKTDV